MRRRGDQPLVAPLSPAPCPGDRARPHRSAARPNQRQQLQDQANPQWPMPPERARLHNCCASLFDPDPKNRSHRAIPSPLLQGVPASVGCTDSGSRPRPIRIQARRRRRSTPSLVGRRFVVAGAWKVIDRGCRKSESPGSTAPRAKLTFRSHWSAVQPPEGRSNQTCTWPVPVAFS